MRSFIAVVLVLSLPQLCFAQEATWPLRNARGLHVAIIDSDSREWQGRLLEVAKDAITLEVGVDARRFEMTAVKRVDAHGDKVWDGALKGVAFGVVLGALVVGGRFAVQSGMAYGLIGLGLDALNNCNHTIYRAPATAAGVKVSW